MNIPKDLGKLSSEKQNEIVDEVRSYFIAAEDARKEREERAIHDYELWRRARRNAEAEMVARGGFSKIEVPMIYWIVEHLVPRLGVQAPQAIVNARSAQAVGFAQAKQMRLQHHLDSCGWDLPYQMVMKSKLIYGDGIAKGRWDHREMRPGFIDVDWFDFFVSAEATRFEAAEWHFHRTYLTKRAIDMMRGQRIDDGKRSLYHNLDGLSPTSTRDMIDETWTRRAGISNANDLVSTGDMSGVVPAVECWSSMGELIVLAGEDYATVIRAQMSPYRRRHADGSFKYLRPFTFFRNTLDLTGPYSMSEAEPLEHHQVELSSMRNAFMDQMNLNNNAPVIYDESLDGAMVEETFSRPGGLLPVAWGASGPPIMRMNPGQVTADYPALYAMLRSEGELISGMNDNAAGQAVSGDQTATEVQLLASEANWRIRLKRRMDEIAMREVVLFFDAVDRQYGGIVSLAVDPGFRASEGARGFLSGGGPRPIDQTLSLMAGANRGVPDMTLGAVRVGPEVNAPEAEYDIDIDAGSSARPDQMQEAQKMNALIGALSHPAMAPLVDWQELTRTLIQTHGQTPERLMIPQQPAAPPGPPVPEEGPPVAEGPPPEEVAA